MTNNHKHRSPHWSKCHKTLGNRYQAKLKNLNKQVKLQVSQYQHHCMDHHQSEHLHIMYLLLNLTNCKLQKQIKKYPYYMSNTLLISYLHSKSQHRRSSPEKYKQGKHYRGINYKNHCTQLNKQLNKHCKFSLVDTKLLDLTQHS